MNRTLMNSSTGSSFVLPGRQRYLVASSRRASTRTPRCATVVEIVLLQLRSGRLCFISEIQSLISEYSSAYDFRVSGYQINRIIDLLIQDYIGITFKVADSPLFQGCDFGVAITRIHDPYKDKHGHDLGQFNVLVPLDKDIMSCTPFSHYKYAKPVPCHLRRRRNARL
ncbi:hypothetical protein QVD17_38592 [Tagetes erecta]|uniref:Uncharacterized protein n=1 Tax=Tagetes erecta TaxID=13708 RepID=A0AAD8NFH7_TARER|nr:hypothetical protein QVD17_38592 [Tagetes erecta]